MGGLFFLEGDVAAVGFSVGGRVAGGAVGRPAMVEVVDHLRLVEGKIAGMGRLGAWDAGDEVVSPQHPSFPLELCAGAEEVGVVGHVEHCAELDAPGVFLRAVFFGLADEYGHPAVDGLGEFGVAFCAEDRAGACVGVEQGEVFGGEGEVAVGLAEVGDAEGEEDEVG